MTETVVDFWWLDSPGARRPVPPWRPLSEACYHESVESSPDRRALLAPPPRWADDLLRVARAVFAADRYASRSDSFDRWSRRIRLSVPVTEPERWQEARPTLAAVVETLTSDSWEFEFRSLAAGIPTTQPFTFHQDDYAHEVALFSGGVDSLAWAAVRATAASGPLLLVSFQEQNFEALQEAVYGRVRRLRTRLVRKDSLKQSVRRLDPKTDPPPERTTRTRGLLYAAGAIQAAAAEYVPVVHIPENGLLALNPALSPARWAACSTRSVHPWTLHHINRLITAVGGAVEVVNPFWNFTKGEVCATAHAAGLPREIMETTLSCSAPPGRQRNGLPLPNCGICYPCLVRRSAIRHAWGRDDTPYAIGPWDPHLDADRTEHWRALGRWLSAEPYTALDLVADAPLPPDHAPQEYLPVIQRSRKELRALMHTAPGGAAA
jgi:hypothetical protein